MLNISPPTAILNMTFPFSDVLCSIYAMAASNVLVSFVSNVK